MASEAILGSKIKHLCFRAGMVTGFWFSSLVCTHGDKCPLVVSNPLGTTWRSDTRKPVRILLIIIFQAMPAKNVLPWRSKSARSQVSTVRFYTSDCDVRVGIGLYRICTWGLFAYKKRVGNAISVKTLVRQSLGLPDLLCRPCYATTCTLKLNAELKDWLIQCVWYESQIFLATSLSEGFCV